MKSLKYLNELMKIKEFRNFTNIKNLLLKIEDIEKNEINLNLRKKNCEYEFKKYYHYHLNFNLIDAKITNTIERGIIISYLNAKNSKIFNKLNSKNVILYEKIFCKNNLEYEMIGKAKKLFHFMEIINFSNTFSSIKIRILNLKKVFSIVKIVIPKKSENSISNLNKVFLNTENSFLISYPIVVLENPTSRVTHSSKSIKMDKDQLFYLKTKGFERKKIENLILESF